VELFNTGKIICNIQNKFSLPGESDSHVPLHIGVYRKSKIPFEEKITKAKVYEAILKLPLIKTRQVGLYDRDQNSAGRSDYIRSIWLLNEIQFVWKLV
jgi:hypothetical protein